MQMDELMKQTASPKPVHEPAAEQASEPKRYTLKSARTALRRMEAEAEKKAEQIAAMKKEITEMKPKMRAMSALIEQLEKEYITGLRVRGVKEKKIIFENVLHNSSAAIITISGLAIGTLMGGSVVIESIFRWAGVGKLVMDSITARDYPVIQGFVLIMAVIYVLINLATDILYRVIDPRIDYEK